MVSKQKLENEPIENKPSASNKRLKAVIIYVVPILIYAILIFYLSIIPLGNVPPGEEEPVVEPGDGAGSGGGGGDGVEDPGELQPAKSILYLKDNVPYFNELTNIFLYLIFGVLLFRTYQYYLPELSKENEAKEGSGMSLELKIILIVVCTACIYSLFIELSQRTEVSRVTDVNDIIYNTIGAVIGSAVMIVKNKMYTNRTLETNK